MAKKVVDEGVSLFHSTIGRLPLFSSIQAHETSELKDRDETHYFLVPYRLSKCGYALYIQRLLPVGVGPENALPKARVFHLPADGTLDTLEKLVADELAEKHRENIDFSAPLADRLDLIADEIDKQSNLVTGGLVVIGGVVAVINPLLGVGIAAKAILPTLGSKLSKHGINHVSDWLRKRKVDKKEKEANELASQEIKKIEPEVTVDATLALLEESISNQDPANDPQMKFAEFLETPEETLKVMVTARAITDVYRSSITDKESHSSANLHPADIDWLKSLADLTA